MSLNGTNSDGMAIFRDVLCGVDGTRSSYEAVRQAAALTAPDGHLTLLSASAQSGAGRYHGSTLAPARARRTLDYAARLARELGAQCDTELASDSSELNMVLARAARHRLLAVGAPSLSRLGELFVGSIATEAAHALPCALLVARRPPAGARFDERILVATDALEHSDELLDFAVALARARDAALIMFHAPGAESGARPTKLANQVERVIAGLNDRASVRIEPGRAHRRMVDTANAERATLIVLASRRATGLRALGSVSERIVHDARCSVLVLRPEDLSGAGRSAASASAAAGSRAG